MLLHICSYLKACTLPVFADTLFLILYKELYYRHVYARVQVYSITVKMITEPTSVSQCYVAVSGSNKFDFKTD